MTVETLSYEIRFLRREQERCYRRGWWYDRQFAAVLEDLIGVFYDRATELP